MASPLWTVGAASVRGRGHEHTGAPCQDSSAVSVSANGQWVALAASDGAGTAKRSEIGSDLVAREFVNCLIRLSEECDRRAPGAWVSDRVIQDIVVLRNQLRERAGSDDLSDFHCTLTAALIGPTGGVTVHLGDGAIFGGAADSRVGDVIDLAADSFVSTPQNGEYANETVFLTERDWVKHLRIHPAAAVDWVMLGTDGGMALAMIGESRPKSGFVVPVIRALIQETDFAARCEALKRILDDRQADRLTNDDKTLIAAIRSQYRDVTGEFGLPAKQGISTTAPPSPGALPVVPQATSSAAWATPATSPAPAPRHGGSRPGARAHRANRSRGWLIGFVVSMLVIAAIVSAAWLIKSRLSGTKTPPAAAVTPPKVTPQPAEAAPIQPAERLAIPVNDAASSAAQAVGKTAEPAASIPTHTTAPPAKPAEKQQPHDLKQPKSGK